MDAKESLLFIGKCLTLDHYPEKVNEIKEVIQAKAVDWEKVVWTASGHLVIPALYLNLKRASLLPELPDDLLKHLKEITDLNRERNQQIIKQAKQVTALLNKHDIAPVFLKGTAYLLSGLYTDIAERMVGDIDFLLSDSKTIEAAEVLLSNEYTSLDGAYPRFINLSRHYPRLIKAGSIAGVEIHRRVIESPFEKRFSYDLINNEKIELDIIEEAYTLSPSHQVVYNMMVVQMNDGGYLRGSVYLKHMYDLLLLSQKVSPLEALKSYGAYFNRLNAYLHLSSKVLGEPACISHEVNRTSKVFLKRFVFLLKANKSPKLLRQFFYVLFRFYNYHKIIVQALLNKERRDYLFYKISAPGWLRKHFTDYIEFFKS